MLDMEITALEFDRVRRQINALETDLRTKVNRAGLAAIAKPLKHDLISVLPTQTGALKRSISYKTLTKRRMGAIGLFDDDAMEVAATRQVVDKSAKKRYQTYKLRFISYGTAPHVIEPRRGGFLKLKGHYATSLQHPGIVGKNYLKNVYDRHQGHMHGLFVAGAQAVLAKHGVVL